MAFERCRVDRRASVLLRWVAKLDPRRPETSQSSARRESSPFERNKWPLWRGQAARVARILADVIVLPRMSGVAPSLFRNPVLGARSREGAIAPPSARDRPIVSSGGRSVVPPTCAREATKTGVGFYGRFSRRPNRRSRIYIARKVVTAYSHGPAWVMESEGYHLSWNYSLNSNGSQ